MSWHRLRIPSDQPGQNCQIRAIKAAQTIIRKGATISLNWVPGHTNVEGNELADKLAKEATEQPPNSNLTSYAFGGMRLKEETSTEWLESLEKLKPRETPSKYHLKFGWKPRFKLRIPPLVKRSTASAFYQMKLGHGYFKSYFNRFKM